MILGNRRARGPLANTRVLLVTESDVRSQPPGKARRFGHVWAWGQARSIQMEAKPLRADLSGRGLALRVVSVLTSIPSIVRATGRGQKVWVLGLGEVHMLLVAMVLAALGRDVTFDACDSWHLQLSARAKTRGGRPYVARIGAVLQRKASLKLAVSYISERDVDADVSLNGNRSVVVVRPVAPPELSEVKPLVPGRISRLVAPVDLQSPHNIAGLRDLLRAWESIAQVLPAVQLEVFGRGVEGLQGTRVVSRGWAANLVDVYEGQTAVYVANREGSGVPNKLVEAAACGRPVIVHSSIAPLVHSGPRVFVYNDGDGDIVRILRAALNAEFSEDDASPSLR